MRRFLSILLLPIVLCSCQADYGNKKVLIYTKNGKGFIHDNIQASVDMLSKIAGENGIDYDVSEEASVFTADRLSEYNAIIFSNTNNEAFDNDDQRQAFKDFIQAGGGFIGIHSACGSERDWPWFWKMLGGTFVRHPPYQSFNVKVIDSTHPSTSFFQGEWEWEDEAYFVNQINPGIHVLLAHDLTTIQDRGKDEYPGKTFGDLFPGAWCQEFDGGRQWYTSYGHKIEHYSDPDYIKHVEGGILWTLEK